MEAASDFTSTSPRAQVLPLGIGTGRLSRLCDAKSESCTSYGCNPRPHVGARRVPATHHVGEHGGPLTRRQASPLPLDQRTSVRTRRCTVTCLRPCRSRWLAYH